MTHRQLVDKFERISLPRTVGLAVRIKSKNVLCARGFRLINRGTFEGAPGLRLGTSYYGFTDARDGGLIRNLGVVRLGSNVVVATGNRWDIGPEASLEVGAGTYFSPFGKIITSKKIEIGSNCAIAWDVQLLDSDFHQYSPGSGIMAPGSAPILIGDHVWIGARAQIYKGVEIANGCVIAGGSVVTRSCTEENCLIGGSPAKILRRGISWS